MIICPGDIIIIIIYNNDNNNNNKLARAQLRVMVVISARPFEEYFETIPNVSDRMYGSRFVFVRAGAGGTTMLRILEMFLSDTLFMFTYAHVFCRWFDFCAINRTCLSDLCF